MRRSGRGFDASGLRWLVPPETWQDMAPAPDLPAPSPSKAEAREALGERRSRGRVRALGGGVRGAKRRGGPAQPGTSNRWSPSPT